MWRSRFEWLDTNRERNTTSVDWKNDNKANRELSGLSREMNEQLKLEKKWRTLKERNPSRIRKITNYFENRNYKLSKKYMTKTVEKNTFDTDDQ